MRLRVVDPSSPHLVASGNPVLRSALRPSNRPRPGETSPAGGLRVPETTGRQPRGAALPPLVVLHNLWTCLWTTGTRPSTAPDDIADGSGSRPQRLCAPSSPTPPGTRGSRASGRSGFEHDVLVLGVPSIVACRADPLELPPDCSTTRSRTAPAASCTSSSSSTPRSATTNPCRSVRAPDSRRPPSSRPRPAASEIDLGAGDAEPPLHVRPVRHRCLEPLRARRRALGRRGAGPGLQPAVHLRPGRASARPTCSTRSGTTSGASTRRSASATCRPSRS